MVSDPNTRKGHMQPNIDWNSVKKQTLWSYEDLIGKLQEVLAYDFVQEHYNHTMKQAQGYADCVRRGYLQDRGDMTAYVDSIKGHFAFLESRGIGTYSEVVQSARTRQDCEAFLLRTDIDFNAFIQTLNFLMRWVLPFKTPLREFIDLDRSESVGLLEALKTLGIKSNVDLLEVGRTEAGRGQLSNKTGKPAAHILILVQRVDISRLAYVRGKTVKHLCGGGYETLEKIANADLAEMEARMDTYYRTLGKTLADFKAVIPLAWMIGGAQIIPRVVMV